MRIGPYRIAETISDSGQALSYRAVHTALEREVFLKVLPAGGGREGERRARFAQEAKALARVDHPAVVRVYEFGEWEGKLYLASEFLPGPDLGELVARSGPLEWPEVRAMAQTLLDGLQKLHEAGIIHRDIKPTNIVLGKRGPKLADLGLARVAESPVETQSDSLLGSPAYMAPEILRGVAAGPRTDLFSFGATMFEILTGQRAFTGETFQEVLANLARCEPMANRAQNLPREARRFLSALLSKDPNDRPADAGAARELLKHPEEVEMEPVAPKRGNRSRIVLAPLLVIVAALGVWVLRPSFEQTVEPVDMSMAPHSIAMVESIESTSHQLEADTIFSPSPLETSTLTNAFVDERPPERGALPGRTPQNGASRAPKPIEEVVPAAENIPLQAELWLFCSPWAEISLDGVVVDTTPLVSPIRIDPGEHTVKFSHPAYPPRELALQVRPGERESLYVALPESSAYLRLQTTPWATISLDGTIVGATPFSDLLIMNPGRHTLVAQNPFYGERFEQFAVARGETMNVVIHFDQEMER